MSPITVTNVSLSARTGRLMLTAAALLAVGGLVACSAPGEGAAGGVPEGASEQTSGFDLTSKNIDSRPHIDEVAEAVAALKGSGFTPIEAGELTVAINGSGTPPTSFLAEDDVKTMLGSDSDVGSLIAEGLGLEYAPINVAWADWPLGVESGKYDLVISNVGVTEERKDLFDFATYRDAIMGFVVGSGSDVQEISKPEDVSGLKVVVGSGTNQEAYLLDWFAQNEAAGIAPGEAVYYDDQAAGLMAITSGRADASILPYSLAAFQAETLGETRIVGKFNSAYPIDGQVGIATAKGNGLAEPVSIVLNSIIASGEYAEVLDRWGQGEEAIGESLVNPPGLPRP
ncbi:polar amino acid transport system substrate-binding protein [Leucobacter exalbidus]|uniref:Polar amino acid transport system substrate-binding protein n=1 Tax=Leucobacter exalbidus TaxID=662960 RepID=A0A940PQ15_9MICO|nr:ABC transporter substrate-binding protein [Leucobacter exalbidus]MBP1327055.1 polar amino acid transport system substrate-binding protein [Leucobacter exalbidus]